MFLGKILDFSQVGLFQSTFPMPCKQGRYSRGIWKLFFNKFISHDRRRVFGKSEALVAVRSLTAGNVKVNAIAAIIHAAMTTQTTGFFLSSSCQVFLLLIRPMKGTPAFLNFLSSFHYSGVMLTYTKMGICSTPTAKLLQVVDMA